MRKSVITYKWYIKHSWSDEVIWCEDTEEMLIPKIIGNIERGFNSIFKHLKKLPLGHRYRGDVEVV
jgi:hypothetical protein